MTASFAILPAMRQRRPLCGAAVTTGMLADWNPSSAGRTGAQVGR
jgi:hypothetical protein